MQNRLIAPLSVGVLALALGLDASGSSLRYAEDQAPGIVNPLFATTMSEARINEIVFGSLYTDDQKLAAVPELARSSTVNSDRTEMVIELRDDIYWHDGTPLSAADVVFTIQAMKDPETLSTEVGRVAWIASAEAQGSRTVKLVFQNPEPSPEDKLYFKILPSHLFDDTVVSRRDPFRNKPIGTGAYRLVRYNDDNSITFAAHESHPSPAGISELVMREVSDKNYQAKLLLYESLEALVRVLPRDLAVLQNNRKVDLYPYQTNSWWYLGFNLERAPFDDPAVRQALASFVDVEALLAPIGTGEVVTGPFVPSSPFYNHDVAQRTVDVTRGAMALEAAGWVREAGGTWAKDGTPLALTVTAHQALESSQEVVINLQSQLQSAGVKVDVEFLDEAAWKARVWRERDFHTVLSQWSFDRNEDVREQLHSQGARNFGGYSSERVDELLDTAATAMDPFAKKTALRQVHAEVNRDVPMVFLWTLDSYAAMSTRVEDVVVHPFYFFTYIRDWRM